MKNYAGHRLAPWLGHLMVSRQETARPLLTPGEVMQFPATDEIVMVAGLPPIRAKKARYYEDIRFTERIAAPPDPTKSNPPQKHNAWAGCIVKPITQPDRDAEASSEDAANAGIRRQPDLPEHEEVVPPPKEPKASREFDLLEDDADEPAKQARAFRQQSRQIAQQASLDPKDGIEL